MAQDFLHLSTGTDIININELGSPTDWLRTRKWPLWWSIHLWAQSRWAPHLCSKGLWPAVPFNVQNNCTH